MLGPVANQTNPYATRLLSQNRIRNRHKIPKSLVKVFDSSFYGQYHLLRLVYPFCFFHIW